MKSLLKLTTLAAFLFLAACADKTAPSIEPGAGDLKLVTSSNILNDNKEPLILGRTDSIVFVLTDSATQVSAKITDASGNLVKVLVQQKGDTITIEPIGGTWNSSRYSITLNAVLTDATPVDLYIGNIPRELGLWMIESNVYDVANSVGYQEVPVNVGTLSMVFDQPIDSIEALTFTQGGVAIAVVSTIAGDSLQVVPQIDSLNYASNYTISFRVYTADGQLATQAFSFKAAGSALVPVATNVEIVGSAVGSLTNEFGLQQTMWVKFSDTLDPDVKKIVWNNGSASNDLYAGGTAAQINADVEISGDTLKVTPNSTMKGVTNGTTVGFSATVRSVKGLTYNIQTLATVTSNDIYVVETNVQNANGLYRTFKVIGDSLVVKFSKKVSQYASARTKFRVNNFVDNYSVSWASDSMTATIKNVDTLSAATFGGDSPYEDGSVATRAYSGITFSLTAVDGEEATVSPVDPIDIHTEYGLAIVNSNILTKHLNSQIVVNATEAAMDTISPTGVITVEFNRAVDTALIKAANPNTHFALIDGAAPTVNLPVTLSFSNALKTVTVTPVTSLKARKSYYLKVISVPGLAIAYAPAISLQSGMATGDGVGGRLTDDALKVFYTPINISALSLSLQLDTLIDNDSVFSAGYTYGTSNETSLRFLLKYPAWNKKHADSVGAYEWRARKTTRAGVVSGWFYASNRLAKTSFDTSSFVTSTSNPPMERINLGMSGESFWSEIRTANKGTGYSNGGSAGALGLFNDSSKIEVQYRAVLDDNLDGDYSDVGEQGVWSSSIAFVDNAAPCEIRTVAKTSMGNANFGGVTVTKNATDLIAPISGAFQMQTTV